MPLLAIAVATQGVYPLSPVMLAVQGLVAAIEAGEVFKHPGGPDNSNDTYIEPLERHNDFDKVNAEDEALLLVIAGWLAQRSTH